MSEEKRKSSPEAIEMIVLRSIYFNHKHSFRIPSESYCIFLPAKTFKETPQEDFDEFLLKAYNDNFNNEDSIEKIISDCYEHIYNQRK